MDGERNIDKLIKMMLPTLNIGEYVFCTIKEEKSFDFSVAIMVFREQEGITVILEKTIADDLNLNYSCVTSWITLNVHSSLEAIGLTATFSDALAKENISCNVVAGFYHDHIFVAKKDGQNAMKVLNRLSMQN